MIPAEEHTETAPICPHCKRDIRVVHYQPTSGFLGRRFIYFCPECRSVLGVTHRKGFWMG